VNQPLFQADDTLRLAVVAALICLVADTIITYLVFRTLKR
jgi:hypothetical protein